MKAMFKTIIFSLAVVALFSCKKESNDSYEVYGPIDSLTASFTVTPVQGDATRFVVTNTTPGIVAGTFWDSDQ
jgi:hypothetical protein